MKAERRSCDRRILFIGYYRTFAAGTIDLSQTGVDKGELLARGFGGGGRREARDKAASPAPCCDLPGEAPVKCANRELSEDYVWRSGLAERHVQDFCSRFSSDDCPPASLVEVTPSWRTESDDGFNAKI